MKNQVYGVLALLIVSNPLSALERSIGLGAELEHSDNSLKTNENERSELEQRVTADVRLEHEGESIVADVNYDAVYIDFDKDTQDDETSVVGNASIIYEQIDNQLFWTLENSRRNVVRDRALADVQSNREDNSISSISPRLILRPTAVDSIDTRLGYSRIDYEDSGEQDSERLSAGVSWQRRLTKVDTVSLNISYQDISFDLGADDYEYYLASVEYSARLSRLNYSVAVGYNESQRDSGDADGGYLDVEADYTSGASRWSLQLLHELTDTSRGNNNSDFTGLGDFSSSGGQVDVFERSNLELGYANSAVCDACTFDASLWYQEEDYKNLDNDNNELAARISLSYRYSRLLTVRGNIGYRDLSFEGANPRNDYDISYYGLNLSQTITRNFSISYQLRFEELSSSANDDNYEELRGGISIRYQFD